MRLDLRLHGRLDDGRTCTALVSVYCKDDDKADRLKATDEAAKIAVWLIDEPGLPDVPDGANITIESIDDLREESMKKHAKMRAIGPGPMMMGGPPGSLPEFLRKIGAGEFIFPDEEKNDGP